MEGVEDSEGSKAFRAMHDFVSAKTDPASEYASLRKHAEYFRRSREEFSEPTQLEKELILQVCEDAYSQVRYKLPDDWLTYSHFERVCYDLERSSSPGYPYCNEKSTIGDWLGFDGIQYDVQRMELLWRHVELFKHGQMDSIYRVFVKTEPHKIAKAIDGRWRLIICPPLYEQVLWAMVFGSGNDRENELVGMSPSLQGFKLCNGGWKQVYELFQQNQFDASLDKSAWDWTAHQVWLDLDLELRKRLLISEGPQRQQWEAIASSLFKGAFYHPRLLLSNGMVFEQEIPGIMKSGCVNTISSNSHMQIFCHIYAALMDGKSIHPLPVAVGDDTLGSMSNTPSQVAYLKTGAIVKQVVQGIDFVGHVWCSTGPRPAYIAKHLFRYCEIEAAHLASFLESMVHLYCHHDEMTDLWRQLCVVHSVEVPSREYIRFWYDYDEDLLRLWKEWHRC